MVAKNIYWYEESDFRLIHKAYLESQNQVQYQKDVHSRFYQREQGNTIYLLNDRTIGRNPNISDDVDKQIFNLFYEANQIRREQNRERVILSSEINLGGAHYYCLEGEITQDEIKYYIRNPRGGKTDGTFFVKPKKDKIRHTYSEDDKIHIEKKYKDHLDFYNAYKDNNKIKNQHAVEPADATKIQEDGSSCGVIACQMAMNIFLGNNVYERLEKNQDQINALRERHYNLVQNDNQAILGELNTNKEQSHDKKEKERIQKRIEDITEQYERFLDQEQSKQMQGLINNTSQQQPRNTATSSSPFPRSSNSTSTRSSSPSFTPIFEKSSNQKSNNLTPEQKKKFSALTDALKKSRFADDTNDNKKPVEVTSVSKKDSEKMPMPAEDRTKNQPIQPQANNIPAGVKQTATPSDDFDFDFDDEDNISDDRKNDRIEEREVDKISNKQNKQENKEIEITTILREVESKEDNILTPAQSRKYEKELNKDRNYRTLRFYKKIARPVNKFLSKIRNVFRKKSAEEKMEIEVRKSDNNAGAYLLSNYLEKGKNSLKTPTYHRSKVKENHFDKGFNR